MDSNYRNIPDFLRNAEDKTPLKEDDLRETSRIVDVAESYPYPELNTRQEWNRFIQTAGIQTGHAPAELMVVKNRKFGMFRWAAAAIFILGTALGIYQYQAYNAETFKAEYSSHSNIETIGLPDGSKITLNRGTVLRVKAINSHKRILELIQGEAFVSVSHSEVPFRVLTKHGIISVLGTEFTVRDVNNQTFNVFLRKGKIRFESENISADLKPGEIIEQDAAGDFTVSMASNSLPTFWVDGKLSFSKTALAEIIQTLEKTYEVRFEYDHSLDTEIITVSFDNLDAGQAARLLSKTLGSEFRLK